jgi:epoxyqueuosine reductase QueG
MLTTNQVIEECAMDSTALSVDLSPSQALRDYAFSLGAELYGVASAAAYVARFPDKPSPRRFVPDAQAIIVIGLPMEPGTMATVLSPQLAGLSAKAADQVGASGVRPAGAERFFLAEEIDTIKRELGLIGYKLAKQLRHQGYAALHLPASKQNDRFRTAPFYHMPAMYLAGMGTLGLNCSILTPEFGPRVFVTSIITNAPLAAGAPLQEELCTRCRKCVEACPIGAIDGEGWKNPFACASYGCCSTCIAICPVGEVRPF